MSAREDGGPHEARLQWTRERFFAAVLEGDVVTASAQMWQLVDEGVPKTAIYSRVMAPALHHVGHLWARAELSISGEHMASSVAGTVLERLASAHGPRSPSAPVAVVACASGEGHSLAARMVADCLGDAGWRVSYVGASAPADDVALFAIRRGARLLALSVTLGDHLLGVRDICRRLDPSTGPFVVLGGQATRALRLPAAELGVDAVCDDLSVLAGVAAGLAAEATGGREPALSAASPGGSPAPLLPHGR